MKTSVLKMVIIVFAILLMSSLSWADKPQRVISMSNGYPSGAHYNLIVHGRGSDTFSCQSTEGGNSVFVADYGNSTIQYISNKKASISGLTVLDSCAEAFAPENDPAQVQLPYDEYFVFARLHGTPKNRNGNPSSVILTPQPVLQLCNYDETNPEANQDEFGTNTECNDSALWALGMVTNSGVYYATQHNAERYDTSTSGKGAKKAQEITGLFTWTGYVCAATLDTNGDGVIDLNDVPGDMDGDGGDIDEADLTLFLTASCDYYENEWVFNLADLVVEDMDFNNSGGKTLQIRFYPRSSTSFESSVPPPTQ